MIKIDQHDKLHAGLEIRGTASILTAEICAAFKELVKTFAENGKVQAIATFKTMGECMADTAEMLCKDFNIAIEDLNDDDEDDYDDDEDIKEAFRKKAEDADILKEFLESLPEEDISYLLDIISKFEDFDEEDD